jgi:hypothetical protein
VFAPVSVKVPVPDFCRTPEPDTTPEYGTSFERLKISVPEFTTLAVAIEPVVDPAPTLTVPAEIVNAPVNVFSPLNVSVPLPCFTTAPALEPFSITPANAVFVESPEVSVPPSSVIVVPVASDATDPTVSLNPFKSKIAVPDNDTAEASGTDPPVRPTAKTPAEIVVAPV